MLDLDVQQFWKDDALAHEENCFSPKAPQAALGLRMSRECVYAELGEKGNPWGDEPRERQLELNKRYNDKAEQIVGKRLLPEELPPENALFPAFRQIGEVFGGKYVFNGSWWLEGHLETSEQLEQQLDWIDTMDFRSFVLPENWEAEKKRIFEAYGKRPGLFTMMRGPVTLACSVYGIENLIFLGYDEPELFARFSETIKNVILKYVDLMGEEAGYTRDILPHGFGFCDDDSCLLTPKLYEQFGYPILRDVFARLSPNPGDERYQHSDSAMGHLLPILGRLDLNGCNFGPTVPVEEIRKYLPHARIDGQLAPYALMRNDLDWIEKDVRRDMAAAHALRGLNITTAGSVNDGSLLTSMRYIMALIQNYGRY